MTLHHVHLRVKISSYLVSLAPFGKTLLSSESNHHDHQDTHTSPHVSQHPFKITEVALTTQQGSYEL